MKTNHRRSFGAVSSLLALAAVAAAPRAAHAQAAPEVAPPPAAPVNEGPQLTAPPTLAPAAPVAPVAPAPEPPAPPAPPGPYAPTLTLNDPTAPRARLDYSDGSFYFRSADDNVILTPGARVHIDTYGFAGKGVEAYRRANGTGLATNMFFRRFILEMGGSIRGKWFFWIGGNFAPSTLDANAATTSSANVYDGFVGYEATPHLRFFAGQYNAPVTMENVTSSRWLDFMERSLSVRTMATPYNKDIGFLGWGETEKGHVEYQLGVLGGDGMNRPSVDNRVDAEGRVIVRPLASQSDATSKFHFGGSFRYGSRDPNHVFYDAPTMSTPGGYAYWSPSYKSGTQEIHIIPSRSQFALAGEVYVPFERFDIRGEVVYLDEGRREVDAVDRGTTLRSGSLSGVGGYAQVSYWPVGTPRIGGNPAGLYYKVRQPKDRGAEAPFGLQLLLRAEAIRLNYRANDHKGDTAGDLSGKTQNIDVNAFQAAVNYWATKHVRLTAEYSLYQFPGTPAVSGGPAPSNEAGAPGARSKANDVTASALHELSFRFGLML